MQLLKHIKFFMVFLFPVLSAAQERLTIEDAVAIALQNNYGVLISGTQVAVDSANATKGNAGFWPVIGFEAGADYGNIFYSNQSFSSGADQSETFAQSWGAGAAAVMSWTIFDGKRMFATYDRLQALSDKSRLQLKADMEAIAANVYDAYYSVVYQQALIAVLDSNMVLYREREALAKRRWELGSTSKLDFLQASLDLKEQQSQRIQLELALVDARAALNSLLSRPPETQFVAIDQFDIPDIPDWDIVLTRAAGNRDVAVFTQQIRLGELQIKEAEADKMPVIAWNSRLNYTYNQNQAGFLQKNQQAGFATGLSLRWNIFDGKNVQRNIQQTKLQVQQYKLQLDNSRLEVQWLVLQGMNRLRSALEQLAFEQEGVSLAQEAILVATERYRLGNGTSLELREVQRSYNDLQARLVAAQYRAKQAQTELEFLQGIVIEK
jgi:outer membrane protein